MPEINAVESEFNTARFAPITHDFAQHPALTMPALRALALRLAATGQCRFIPPDATQTSAFDHQPAPANGAGIDEVFDQIAKPGAWIALYNIESDPQYKRFLSEVRTAFDPLLRAEQSGVFNVGGFVFISCAPSITPFHIDRENNFWLQIRGEKTISVWAADDPSVIHPATAEKFILNRDLADVRLTDEINRYRHDFQMQPGQGLFFPSLTPHMTRCDPPPSDQLTEPSISIGVVFYSDQTRHQAQAMAFNRLLRRAGLNPAPPANVKPGQRSGWRDRAKAIAGKAMVRAMVGLRNFDPPPGL